MIRILKKTLPLLIILCLLFSLFAVQVSAAGSSVAFSKSKLTVGETLTVTVRFSTSSGDPMYGLECYVDYDPKVLQFTAGNNTNQITDGRVKLVLMSDGKVSLSERITFKSLKIGSSAVQVKDITYVDKNLVEKSLASSSATVTVINTASEASSNANLKGLNVSAGQLTPAFSPNVTSYRVTIDNSVTELWVQPSKADAKATYVVQGGANMEVGHNTRTIVVTAENGNVKSYTVNIIRLDENGQVPNDNTPEIGNAIEVTANGDTLYIDEDFSDVEIPTGFEIIEYVYNGSTVPALSDGSYVVFNLIDPDEVNTGLYVLKSDLDFMAFTKLEVGGQKYYVLPTDKIPEGYTAAQGCQIGEISVPAFVSTDAALSDFFLIYAKGPAGKNAYYLYDMVDQTLQRQVSLSFAEHKPQDEEREQPVGIIDSIKAMTLVGKIVAITILAIILLLIAAIVVLIVIIAKSGPEKKAKKKKSKKELLEELPPTVGFEYITIEETPAEEPPATEEASTVEEAETEQTSEEDKEKDE